MKLERMSLANASVELISPRCASTKDESIDRFRSSPLYSLSPNVKYSEAFLHFDGCCFFGTCDVAVRLLVTVHDFEALTLTEGSQGSQEDEERSKPDYKWDADPQHFDFRFKSTTSEPISAR